MMMMSPADKALSLIPESIKRYLPLFCVFCSGIGFSLQTLVVKLLQENGFTSSFQMIFARGIIQWLLAGLAVRWAVSTPVGSEKGPLLGPTLRVTIFMFLRSAIGFGGIGFSFLAVQYLPLADAICLVMLSPLIASTLAYFVLGEPYQIPEMLATGISIIGMIFIVKPAFLFSKDLSLNMVGVTFGIISAFSAGSAYLLVRILGTIAKMPWENVCLVQAIGQVILAPLFLMAFNQPFVWSLSSYEFFMIATGSTIGAFSQILMTVGMQREKSAAAGAMRMSDVLFGFIWQQSFTKDSVSFLSIIGAVMIMCSVMIIVLNKEKAQKVVVDKNINIVNNISSSSKNKSKMNEKKDVIYNPIATFEVGDDDEIAQVDFDDEEV